MPDYEITSPDGKRFRVTAPDGATEQDVLAYAQSQFAQQAPAPPAQAPAQPAPQPAAVSQQPQQENTWGNAIKNVGEAAAHFGTSITGGLAGDVAGLGTMAADIATFGKFNLDPAGVRQKVSSALTYQPANPESATNTVLTYPGKVIGGAGDYLGERADNAGMHNLAHFARAAPLALASYGGVKAAQGPRFNAKPFGGAGKMAVPEPVPGTPAPPAPAATPEQIAVKGATDIGLKLQPSTVGNKAGNVVEGLSGRAPLARSLSVENAKAVDAAAGKAVGIANKPVNRVTVGIEKAKAGKAYDALAKTGIRKVSDDFRKEIAAIDDRSGGGSFADDAPPAVANLKQIYGKQKQFDAGDAVARIRKLRNDARDNFKTRDPDKKAIAHVQQKIADALDNELARHVEDLGQPELAANYKAARVQLAKLNTVEQALAGANVSAKKIWQQWKRGAPLDGELLAIAKAYDHFPQVLQDVSKLVGTHPFSAVDYLVAGAGSAAGAALNPALLATVAARPAARAALSSNFYQNRFVRPKGGAKSQAKAPPKVAPAVTVAAPRERRAR
jgi:hypothetical protein